MSNTNQTLFERLPKITVLFILMIILSIIIHIIDALISEDLGSTARFIDYLVAILLVVNIGWLIYDKMGKTEQD